MELLIIGSGGHGKVVAEVARACGYDTIAFLDDQAPEAIGTIRDLERFADRYEHVFIGIGSNPLRAQLYARAEAAGYTVPVLIHPTAYVSPSARIEAGTVVEPKAIVNANTLIKIGTIVSVGAIVDHDVLVEPFSHINAGAIVKAGAKVPSGTKLEAGQVVLGYR